MHTTICPRCGLKFTAHPDYPFVDDTGTEFCSLPCMQIAGLFVGQNDADDIFSQMFNVEVL